MRIAGKCMVLVASWSFGCFALAQSSKQPVITIDSRNTTVVSGEPVPLHIVLKNTTNREFSVFRSVGGARGEHHYSQNRPGLAPAKKQLATFAD